MKEKKFYQVSELISLKLDKMGHTQIFINGKERIYCKALLINISIKDGKGYPNIESIDQAARELKRAPDSFKISHETEFWGHCSNLQTWYDNDYNTRILHSNIAFNLLKTLVDAGDPKAINVLKKEIVDRIESKEKSVINYLLEENFMKYFNDEEIDILREDLLKDYLYKGTFPILIAGGMGEDNNMTAFNDYYYTINKMAGKLRLLGDKPPYTIVSAKEVYECAGSGNNVQFMAITYNNDIEIENLWEIEEEKIGIIKDVAVNERDFILSRKWVKEWIFEEGLGEWERDYRLLLKGDKFAIKTGDLTIV